MAKAKSSATDLSAQFAESINELNKAANRADFTKFQGRGGVAAKGVDVCAVYVKVRPFLEIILKIPVIIPEKVKQAIRLLMSVLDTQCPR